MERLVDIFSSANPNMQVFALTTVAALIAWIAKSFVEGPLVESKATFTRIVDKRMEILVAIKIKLQFIKVFQGQRESEELKEQLYQMLLKDGRCCFVDPRTLEEIMAVSVHKVTDNNIIDAAILKIDTDLAGQVGKIRDEIAFYHRFSSPNPFKRVFGILRLAFEYLVTVVAVISGLSITVYLAYRIFRWLVN